MFAAVLLSWLLFPLVQQGTAAQDGLAYVAAGHLVSSHPDAVYAHRVSHTAWRLDRRFYDTACKLAPVGTNCREVIVPFLSAPATLPLVAVLGPFRGDAGTLVMRYIGVGALAAGMWVLWRRRNVTDSSIAVAFVVAALLMTPFAYEMSSVGQTSALIFLSACIGLPAAPRRVASWASAGTWAATIAFKVFPAAMVIVLIVRRRWRILVLATVAVAALTLAGVLLAPGSLGKFVDQLRPTTTTQVANADNASIDAVVRLVQKSWGASSFWFVPALVVRLLVVFGIGAIALGRADDDMAWCYGWIALLVVEPIVWWHYLAVVVSFAAVFAERRSGVAWVVPLAALPLVPLALPLDSRLLACLASGALVAAIGAAVYLRGEVLHPQVGGRTADLVG